MSKQLAPAPPKGRLLWFGSRLCVHCGRKIERERYCYVVPTCYTCLPPPPELETIPYPSKAPEEFASD